MNLADYLWFNSQVKFLFPFCFYSFHVCCVSLVANFIRWLDLSIQRWRRPPDFAKRLARRFGCFKANECIWLGGPFGKRKVLWHGNYFWPFFQSGHAKGPAKGRGNVTYSTWAMTSDLFQSECVFYFVENGGQWRSFAEKSQTHARDRLGKIDSPLIIIKLSDLSSVSRSVRFMASPLSALIRAF